MKTLNPQIIVLFLLVVGGFLFLGGIVGLSSLFIASKDCETTTGVVKKYQSKRVYRHRKIRYENEMLICYSTPRYGDLYVSEKSYCPFRKVGDEVTVWYHPEHPREIRLLVLECCIWGVLLVFGVLCIAAGGFLKMRGKPDNVNR